MSHAQERSRRYRRKTTPWRVVPLICISIVGVFLAATVWVGIRGVLAKSALEAAVPLAVRLQSQVIDGRGEEADQTLQALAEEAELAESLTGDPIWHSFEVIPGVGANLTAVRQLASVVAGVTRDVARPLVAVGHTFDLDAFGPNEGAFDLGPMIAAQDGVLSANRGLLDAARETQRIDANGTLEPISSAVMQLEEALQESQVAVEAVSNVLQLAPAMLGATEERDYILLFQNPGELRATGGIPGAAALIHTADGRIGLTQQASTADFPAYPSPVVDLPPETRNLYGDITGRYLQDVNLTPDFALSGSLVREMWRLEFGVEADGVMSIDPIALSYLLGATGPVTLPTGDVLTQENAVQTLLRDVYARYPDPLQQDAFFAAAAAAVFSAVAGGSAEPVAVVEALAMAGSERRVLVWSAHAEDQTILAGTGLDGGLPLSDEKAQRLGVYFNDATGAKMDVYLDIKTGVGQSTCRLDRRPVYSVDVTLENTVSPDVVSDLSTRVTGGGTYGVVPGNIKTIVSVYGAPTMQNLGVTRDGVAEPHHPTSDSTYPVSSLGVELGPGESTVLRFSWLGAAPFDGGVELQVTPVIHRNETQKLEITC